MIKEEFTITKVEPKCYSEPEQYTLVPVVASQMISKAFFDQKENGQEVTK